MGNSERVGVLAGGNEAVEHLSRDLARVRAKFGVDPALAPRSLDAAWMTETAVEEDEAEFVDTVADCLGAGLSLDDALTCWDTGGLATVAIGDGTAWGDADADGDADSDADTDSAPLWLGRPRGAGAHRVLVR
ncbi:MAG: hypothetical protein ABUS79_05055 [Pseudomonadota bacterium]